MKFILPKKHLLKIHRTAHLPFTREGLELLDKNERTADFPPALMEELRQRLSPHLLRAYPEPEPLYRKLSSWLGVAREMLLLTAGCDSGLRSIYDTFVEPGQEVVSVRPSYAMIPVYAQIAGATSREVSFDERLTLPIQRILETIGPKTKLVVLAHPNQPIERLYSDSEIQAVLERCEQTHTLLVLDEAYYHFGSSTALPYLKEYGNLVIARTFSKAFGLAGLRLGYLISHPQNIEALNKVRPMYETNSMAITAGLYLLENDHWMTSYVGQVREGMQTLREGLNRMGFKTLGQWGNSILVSLTFDQSAESMAQQLKKSGFLIRAENQFPLSNHLRITAGPPEQAQHFLNELEALLQKVS